MTDYAAMTDRELDALVAERVMGWLHVPVGNPPQLAWLSSKWSSIIEDGPPHFSTDANAALAVLNHFSAQGVNWQCDNVGYEGHHIRQLIHRVLIGWGDDVTSGWCEHVSLPRAICLAALSATEPE